MYFRLMSDYIARLAMAARVRHYVWSIVWIGIIEDRNVRSALYNEHANALKDHDLAGATRSDSDK